MMNRKILAISITVLLVLSVSASVSPSFAVPLPYTLTTGKLGGADYAIYMPTANWNGRLVVGCNGYNAFSDPHQELSFGTLAAWLTSIGYAFASTNYNGGDRAWLVKEGIIRTHQLTQYMIDNYHVNGKIFLIGASMGGEIALDLANKYPKLYSGVLDVCGAKDSVSSYAYAQFWITNTPAQLRAIFGIPAAVTDTDIISLQSFFSTVWADIIAAEGGTPQEKPKAYQQEDPMFHAQLTIPTISLLGAIDPICIPAFHTNYLAAVTTAGSASLYRQYYVAFGGHCDTPVLSQVPAELLELFAWSDSLD
jgi:hypothetical protein